MKIRKIHGPYFFVYLALNFDNFLRCHKYSRTQTNLECEFRSSKMTTLESLSFQNHKKASLWSLWQCQKWHFLRLQVCKKKIDFTQNSLGKPEEKWKISYHLSSLCEINLQSTSWVLKLILWNQYLWKLKFWPYLTAKIWDLISFRLTKWAKKHIFWFWTSWFSKIEGLCIGSVGPCIFLMGPCIFLISEN